MVQSVFGVWDYIIMTATMIASIAIGVYFRFSGGKQKTNDEYLLADRNMSIFPVAVSLIASAMSAITLLGVSSENYYYGMQFIVINISYGIATPIASRLYLPVFFNLQKTSTYEYLELRFGPHVRMLASLTYTLQMVLYNGIVLYAPALVLESVTGLDRLVSMLVVGLVCTFYSTLGGMKAVLFTDLLQAFLMFAALFSIVIFASIQLGGFDQIFVRAQTGGRLDFSNYSIDPTERHTWWSLIIGGLITYLSLTSVNHTQVQRLLTVSTLERSQQCLWWSLPVLSLLSLITCISGLSIYAIFQDCDPLTSKRINAIDQLMPYYVVDAMHSVPGLAGLFVAGIFSASLSTISASCNALAAVTLTDYINRWCSIKQSYIPWLTKLTACAYGLVFLALAFVAEHLGGVLQAALTIFGAVGGPLLGTFTLGMFTTYANERGVSIALLSGMATTLWISFGGPRPFPNKLPLSVDGCPFNVTLPTATPQREYFYLYRLSYMWTSPIGFVWVIVVGSVISLLWRQQQPWDKAGCSGPDPALFSPPVAARLRARTVKSGVQEYLLADRNMSIFPVAVSLIASAMSAITLLGVSSENYYYGMQFIVINISYGIATPIASRLYLPVFFNLQKTSTYEYLELRFGPHVRMLASLTYTLQMVLYNGIVLYAPALVLESVTGLDRLVSMLVVGLVCTFYSTLGGMKAVLFTDLLQAFLMFAALFSIVIFASIQLGGFDQIFVRAQTGGRLDFSNYSIDPTERHTWWSLIIGGLITYLSLTSVNHTQVQRLLTVSTLERSQQCLWWSLPVLSLLSLITCISGLSIYAIFQDCDPLTSKRINAIDQLMPYYVVDAMHSVPGLAGLFVAGIFSASLSTISASCNALAAVTLTDYINRWCSIKQSYIPWLTKLTACAYGLVFLALAFVAEHLGGVLQAALTIFGAVGGPLLGTFTLGMFTTYANERGVSIALLSGMATTLWISFGGPRPFPNKLPLSVDGCPFNVTLPTATPQREYFYLYRLSYMWTSPIGFVWVIVVGSVISLLWRQQQPWDKAGCSGPDPALFSPPVAARLRARTVKSGVQGELMKDYGD